VFGRVVARDRKSIKIPNGDKLGFDPTPRQIDTILEDEAVVRVAAALAAPHPLNQPRVRLGTAATVVLRMAVLTGTPAAPRVSCASGC
jgi:hypothetical protein